MAEIVDRKKGKNTDKAVNSQWRRFKVKQKHRERERTQKETKTLHSLCSQIYTWVDMHHERHSTNSLWHIHETKQNVKWAPCDAHSAFLFVVVFFCALWQENVNHIDMTSVKHKTRWKKQQELCKNRKLQPYGDSTNTLVHRMVCELECVFQITANSWEGSGEVSDSATQRWQDGGCGWVTVQCWEDKSLLETSGRTLSYEEHVNTQVGGASQVVWCKTDEKEKKTREILGVK